MPRYSVLVSLKEKSRPTFIAINLAVFVYSFQLNLLLTSCIISRISSNGSSKLVKAAELVPD